MKLEKFVCKIYASKSNISDVNECRYILFTSRRGEIDSVHLPPCKDALHQHAMRANYLAGLWRQSLVNEMEIPSALDHGWKEASGQLRPLWMTCLPAPEAVLELLSCDCKKFCGESCPCKNNNMKCTMMCKVHPCDNWPDEPVIDYAEEDDESDSEED